MALSERDGEGAAPTDRGAANKETEQIAVTGMEVKNDYQWNIGRVL